MVEVAAYKVEKKEERIRPLPTGEIVTVYRIWATSKKGTYYHIEVREDELKNAPALLTARAQELDSL